MLYNFVSDLVGFIILSLAWYRFITTLLVGVSELSETFGWSWRGLLLHIFSTATLVALVYFPIWCIYSAFLRR